MSDTEHDGSGPSGDPDGDHENPKDEPGDAAAGAEATAATEDKDPAEAKDTAASEVAATGKPAGGRRRRALRWAAIGGAVVLLAGAGTAYGLYRDLWGNITHEHVQDQLGKDRPRKLNKSLNILLLGSDTRAGANSRYGGEANIPGARSDTTILLHLSPNRDQAVAISFPRDSMVHMPACKRKKAATVPAQFGMLNSAFANAGATCTWKTIESLTDVHIDHYVEIDFSGFKRVVDALGGVEICVPHAIDDPRAELHLKAGRQTVKGDDALGYVRARYTLGNGSDLDRIQRQQKFMGAVVKKATASSLLTDPAKTYAFLSAVTKSISTDDELSLSTMRKLASSVKGMSAGKVRFVTVPVEAYAPDPNRVQWNMSAAKPLFEALRADDAMPAQPSASPGPQEAPPAPGQVHVRVVDAGGKSGKDSPGRRAAAQLRQRGFKVDAKVATGPRTVANEIRYGSGGERQAGAIAPLLPGGQMTIDRSINDDTVVVVIGSGGFRLAPPSIADVGATTAQQPACTD